MNSASPVRICNWRWMLDIRNIYCKLKTVSFYLKSISICQLHTTYVIPWQCLLSSTFTCQCWRLVTLWHSDFVSCRTKAVCSMAHINSIILDITRSKNNEVVDNFHIIANWDMTIFCPRVIKRAFACCMARESTGGLHFTSHWRQGNVFSYSGWTCASKNKKSQSTKQRDKRIKPKTTEIADKYFQTFI